MNKRWSLACVGLVALAGLVVFGIPLFTPPTPGVTFANYSRIEKRMKGSDLDALLGEATLERSGIDEQSREEVGLKRWTNERGDTLEIFFDKNGCVFQARWNGWTDDRNFLEKIRDRFPLIAKEPPRRLRDVTF